MRRGRENPSATPKLDMRVCPHGGELTVRVGADRRITMEGTRCGYTT